jgi:hypothetical protein
MLYIHDYRIKNPGSLFRGMFTLGLVAHAFIWSAGNRVRISFPGSPDNCHRFSGRLTLVN